MPYKALQIFFSKRPNSYFSHLPTYFSLPYLLIARHNALFALSSNPRNVSSWSSASVVSTDICMAHYLSSPLGICLPVSFEFFPDHPT